jgi:hypothetical protein
MIRSKWVGSALVLVAGVLLSAGSHAQQPAKTTKPASKRTAGTGFAMGGVYAALPANSMSIPKNGTTYYRNVNT